ncbi:PucR family transcriptional regulator [Paenibacillus koleovorans]|uniref:PucR family transcriptional regulator n=1 Tax=Paenibacillus koleovorans TaxID=121608 RepID=UPI000FDB10CF|nr:PucR family transcriptional regulator [Paenibacillus koleovorans]
MLTVREILQRPVFSSATILAGEGGLDRPVRWVHILEETDAERFVNGEELILTTGILISMDAAASVRYMEKLIAQDVSCLCLELSTRFDQVPSQMLELAERHKFPLLAFPKTVRFIDITQDINSSIINRHQLNLRELEMISRQFHRMTLTSQGMPSVLKLLQASTASQVVFLPAEGQPVFVPSLPPKSQEDTLDMLNGWLRVEKEDAWETEPLLKEWRERIALAQAVGALGKTWGFLVMLLDRKTQERDYLILDAAALSVAHDLLRKRYMEERRLYSENLWVDDLLLGRVRDVERLSAVTGVHTLSSREQLYRIGIIEFGEAAGYEKLEDYGEDTIGLHLSIMVRSLFELQGFHPFMTLKNNRLVVIAVNKSSPKSFAGRYQKVISQLFALREEKIGDLQLRVGISRTYRNLLEAPDGYKESVQAMSVLPCLRSEAIYYDELGVYQLLQSIEDRSVLQQYVFTQLGPLLEHDKEKGSELARTLEVYLELDGSKADAAERLFIVRQSLYYRLKKITQLLGPDCLIGERRLALQMAIRARLFLDKAKGGL